MPGEFTVGQPIADPEKDLFVARPVADELVELLVKGRSCQLVGPPRLGKSTVCFLVRRRLRRMGRAVALVSGDRLDKRATAEDLIRELATSLQRKRPAGSLLEAIRALCDEGGFSLVFDDLNELHSFDWRQELFRALGELLRDPKRKDRIALLLVGSMELQDLGVTDATLLELDRRELRDFSRQELDVFLPGLEGIEAPATWLDAIHDCVSGHPLLTQKLCRAVVDGDIPSGPDPKARIAAQEARMLGEGQPREPTLDVVEKDLDRLRSSLPEPEQIDLLQLYAEVLRGKASFAPTDENLLPARRLRTLGLGRFAGQPERLQIRPRCRLFEKAFDEAWVAARIARSLRPYVQRAGQFESQGHPAELVPRGRELQAALSWFEVHRGQLTRAERLYYEACLHADSGRRRRQNMLVVGVLTVLTTVLLAVTAISYGAYRQAAAKKQEAESRAQQEARRARYAEAEAERQRNRLDEIRRQQTPVRPDVRWTDALETWHRELDRLMTLRADPDSVAARRRMSTLGGALVDQAFDGLTTCDVVVRTATREINEIGGRCETATQGTIWMLEDQLARCRSRRADCREISQDLLRALSVAEGNRRTCETRLTASDSARRACESRPPPPCPPAPQCPAGQSSQPQTAGASGGPQTDGGPGTPPDGGPGNPPDGGPGNPSGGDPSNPSDGGS